MKISVNNPCPCGSSKKYKKCCQPFHKGANPKNALSLMKLRYSAYVVGDSSYIIKTTHCDNLDFNLDTIKWKNSIDKFTKITKFLSLDILEFIDGEDEAYVEFIATFESGKLTEKSRFLKVDGRWLYIDGEFK